MVIPWNPVIAGICCAAILTAMVAVSRLVGVEAPLTYWTAAVGGMFWGGVAAIILTRIPQMDRCASCSARQIW